MLAGIARNGGLVLGGGCSSVVVQCGHVTLVNLFLKEFLALLRRQGTERGVYGLTQRSWPYQGSLQRNPNIFLSLLQGFFFSETSLWLQRRSFCSPRWFAAADREEEQ
ncbi:hypothetical protein Y032_0013g1973 [Ancylostoma ceylanicum]|uniref:Uncharacterized protein n=1 Tax=Ancylostoma ceylanicum TaxID=53326 RepID=A0A016VC41_9BILA|nr:hypothetical protein Y032_0013g1973 [Ancylostoma ceylanicum]